MTDCAGDGTPIDNEPKKVMSQNNIWRFELSDSSMKIYCNGEMVVNLNFKDVSEACYNRWGGGDSVHTISFNGDHDRASKEWRIPGTN